MAIEWKNVLRSYFRYLWIGWMTGGTIAIPMIFLLSQGGTEFMMGLEGVYKDLFFIIGLLYFFVYIPLASIFIINLFVTDFYNIQKTKERKAKINPTRPLKVTGRDIFLLGFVYGLIILGFSYFYLLYGYPVGHGAFMGCMIGMGLVLWIWFNGVVINQWKYLRRNHSFYKQLLKHNVEIRDLQHFRSIWNQHNKWYRKNKW